MCKNYFLALAPADRYWLVGCPVRGLRKEVFPEGEGRVKFHAFLEKNQPLDPKVGAELNIFPDVLKFTVTYPQTSQSQGHSQLCFS